MPLVRPAVICLIKKTAHGQMDSPLMEAGMDSLSSVEFRNQAGCCQLFKLHLRPCKPYTLNVKPTALNQLC